MGNKNIKKTWIEYGIFAVVAIGLYVTGMHTELIGFAQRGLLATGLMNPDVEKITEERNDGNEREKAIATELVAADFNLKLRDREGHIVSMSELKGKVIFMNFWATWCPPCIAEMPGIDKLHEALGDEVVFLMVSLDEDFEKAKAFDTRKDYDLPIYTPASSLPEMYSSSAIPTTYVIDVQGNLALIHEGMADYNDSEFRTFLMGLK